MSDSVRRALRLMVQRFKPQESSTSSGGEGGGGGRRRSGAAGQQQQQSSSQQATGDISGNNNHDTAETTNSSASECDIVEPTTRPTTPPPQSNHPQPHHHHRQDHEANITKLPPSGSASSSSSFAEASSATAAASSSSPVCNINSDGTIHNKSSTLPSIDPVIGNSDNDSKSTSVGGDPQNSNSSSNNESNLAVNSSESGSGGDSQSVAQNDVPIAQVGAPTTETSSSSPSPSQPPANIPSPSAPGSPAATRGDGAGRTFATLTMNLTLNVRNIHPRLHHHLQQQVAQTLFGVGGVMEDALANVGAAAGGAVAAGAGAPNGALGTGLLEPDPLLARARHRLYSLLLLRAAMAYFLTIPSLFRKALEYTVLAAAILSFALLIHLHVIFIRMPLTCLEGVQDNWPRDGILRVQIGSGGGGYRQLDLGSPLTPEDFALARLEEKLVNLSSFSPTSRKMARPLTLDQFRVELAATSIFAPRNHHSTKAGRRNGSTYLAPPVYYSHLLNDSSLQDEAMLRTIEYYPRKNAWPQQYMVEYSLEYGLLRLSEDMRAHYNVPVMTVQLCPDKDACFGDPLARFMLRHFLGYDDVLIGSIKRLAEHENNRGYVRNVATGEHFRFVNVWMTRASYIAAGFIMIVFTLFVSMLIRYSHQQVFVFVSEFLRTVEMQQPFSRITMLAASLITVILALIGMEAIMYEFFSDSSIAFHVIIMVWAADQFDSMAIRSAISKRHFLRFFYLYQFAFYAYHYRFNGQYAGLALLTTMLFTYHAMIFFFHHYELPLVQAMEQAIRAQHHGPGGEGRGGIAEEGQQGQEEGGGGGAPGESLPGTPSRQSTSPSSDATQRPAMNGSTSSTANASQTVPHSDNSHQNDGADSSPHRHHNHQHYSSPSSNHDHGHNDQGHDHDHHGHHCTSSQAICQVHGHSHSGPGHTHIIHHGHVHTVPSAVPHYAVHHHTHHSHGPLHLHHHCARNHGNTGSASSPLQPSPESAANTASAVNLPSNCEPSLTFAPNPPPTSQPPPSGGCTSSKDSGTCTSPTTTTTQGGQTQSQPHGNSTESIHSLIDFEID